MTGKNGNARAEALKLGSTDNELPHIAILFAGWVEVLLSLTASDFERDTIAEEVRGWEARPTLAKLIDRLERRATNEDDRWILDRAHKRRRWLPEAATETAPDPELEQLILERVATKVQAEAIAEKWLDTQVAIHVQMRKAKTPADVVKLQAKAAVAADERKHAVNVLEREISRLQELLTQRANRRRALLLAESTKS